MGVCIPSGVAIEIAVFVVEALICEPFELVLRSKADRELSFRPNDDKEAKDVVEASEEPETKVPGVGGAYDGVKGWYSKGSVAV